MKAIRLAQAEITSINARVDRSIRFSVVTGELQDGERAAFFPLQGTNVRLLIEPLDTESDPPIEVASKIDNKSPSQRLRSILFLVWKAAGSSGDFSVYYSSRIEKIIQKAKDELTALEG